MSDTDSTSDLLRNKLESFFSTHTLDKQTPKVIVITSGGTTVNLDIFGIRCIDNFSTGKRGSELSEFFLENGYLVILLSRTNAYLPYLRALLNRENPYSLLDWLSVNDNSTLTLTPSHEFLHSVLNDVDSYKKYKSNFFLELFTTINEYRDKLSVIIGFCNKYKENVAYCLAAAASDFSLTDENLMREKFSSKNALSLLLEPLPKVRSLIREIGGNYPMLCCFKMSTNRSDMEASSSDMLKHPTYADMVVCNMFGERLTNVSVAYPDLPRKPLENNPSELNKLIGKEILETHLRKISSFK